MTQSQPADLFSFRLLAALPSFSASKKLIFNHLESTDRPFAPHGIFLANLMTMMMTIIIVVLPGRRRKEVLEALCRFKQSTEISGGCMGCHISRDLDKRNMIFYWEEWQSREDLERHIRSPKYRQLLEIIELSAQKPEIKFLTITKTEGLEVVERVRISR